ncbi:MAG: metalloregulator ArsR/SmtB family transcription factor [Verrucomicrobiota bacterium]
MATKLRSTWTALSDPTRLRLCALLREEELSVGELQDILRLGQSRISTHLGVLKGAGLVSPRREGKHTYYSLANAASNGARPVLDAAWATLDEIPEAKRDAAALQVVLDKRRAATREYFNKVAGRLGKSYCPGRSWREVGPLLALLVPDVTVADLGAGEGWLVQLLAQNARKVIAVDNSPKMVAFAKAEFSKRKIRNVEYRLGDIARPPIKPASVDLAILSQALHHAVKPPEAVAAAARILKPGGRVVILDLNLHHVDKARELYGDTWLGFAEADLRRWLKAAGLSKISTQLLAPEDDPPHFQPVLATARKP